jgi:hypothetical protein
MKARISTFYNLSNYIGGMQDVPITISGYRFIVPVPYSPSLKHGLKLDLSIKNLNLLVRKGLGNQTGAELKVNFKKIDWFLQWNSSENNSRNPNFIFGMHGGVGFSVGNDKKVKSIGKKIVEVVNSENRMEKLNSVSEEILPPDYTFSVSKLIFSATENIDLFFFIGFLLLLVKTFYGSYQENDGLNYQENSVNIWNQKVPLKVLKDLNLNKKPKKFRKKYFIPTVLISSSFLETIYIKQKNTANFQSKEEITQDFLIYRNLIQNRLTENATTLIAIAANKYVWIAIYKCISFVDSNFKIALVIKRIWFIHSKYTNSTISNLFCAFCLYMLYRFIFSANKKVVKVIIQTYENVVNISIRRIFLWCN